MKMYTKENLSTTIKAYRKQKGLTQEEFAKKANISLRAVTKLEGKPKPKETLQIDLIEKALAAAECSLLISKNF